MDIAFDGADDQGALGGAVHFRKDFLQFFESGLHGFCRHHDLGQVYFSGTVAVSDFRHGSGKAFFDNGFRRNPIVQQCFDEGGRFFFFSVLYCSFDSFQRRQVFRGGALCFRLFRKGSGPDEIPGAGVKAQKQSGIDESILDILVQGVDNGGIHAAGKGHGEEGCINPGPGRKAEGNVACAHNAGKTEFLLI